MAEITLYHYWRSSSSWRVRFALAQKGIAFESRPVNLLANEQSSEAYRAISPTGYIPALIIDGHTLTESIAICEYLEDTRPTTPLRPADPYLRARLRQFVEIVNSGTQPLHNLAVLRRVKSVGGDPDAWGNHFVERGVQSLENLLASLRAEGVTGPFSFGPELSLADICLVPQMYNARRFNVDLTPFPLCREVEAAALATPASQAAHADTWAPPAT
jgi:maleylacetoacetate isomerase